MCIRDRKEWTAINPAFLEARAERGGVQGKRIIQDDAVHPIDVLEVWAFDRQAKAPNFAQALAIEPVSYTHLDVYKRQVQGIWAKSIRH